MVVGGGVGGGSDSRPLVNYRTMPQIELCAAPLLPGSFAFSIPRAPRLLDPQICAKVGEKHIPEEIKTNKSRNRLRVYKGPNLHAVPNTLIKI